MQTDRALHEYLTALTPKRHQVLAEMERYARTHGFPIIGPLVGRILYQAAILTDARHILELGSGYGYSAFWFSLAIGSKGRIVMTDGDPANQERAAGYFRKARLRTKFDFRVGDALTMARPEKGPFDIILNDIDKHEYPETIDFAARRLRRGGLFITDNIIWSGRVYRPRPDRTTVRIVEFTRKLYADKRFFTTVLPIRDGISVALRL